MSICQRSFKLTTGLGARLPRVQNHATDVIPESAGFQKQIFRPGSCPPGAKLERRPVGLSGLLVLSVPVFLVSNNHLDAGTHVLLIFRSEEHTSELQSLAY